MKQNLEHFKMINQRLLSFAANQKCFCLRFGKYLLERLCFRF